MKWFKPKVVEKKVFCLACKQEKLLEQIKNVDE